MFTAAGSCVIDSMGASVAEPIAFSDVVAGCEGSAGVEVMGRSAISTAGAGSGWVEAIARLWGVRVLRRCAAMTQDQTKWDDQCGVDCPLSPHHKRWGERRGGLVFATEMSKVLKEQARGEVGLRVCCSGKGGCIGIKAQ
jgi:hypothetical protein